MSVTIYYKFLSTSSEFSFDFIDTVLSGLEVFKPWYDFIIKNDFTFSDCFDIERTVSFEWFFTKRLSEFC